MHQHLLRRRPLLQHRLRGRSGYGLPGLLGAPEWLDQTCQLIALGWALWLEWFAARLALELPSLPAAGLVALDVGLGLLLVALAGPVTP